MELQALIDGLKAHKNGAASYESVDEAIQVFEAMRDVDGEKVVNGLICHVFGHPHTRCHKCPYWGTGPHGSSECNVLANDALALIRQQQERIKAQDEVIRALRKVGYPHNFQREPTWIVNFMYAITDVIKKAVKLE